MKYIDEYRDEKLARSLVERLKQTATKPWVLMEICGGQTHTLMRYGIDELLPAGMQMVHGPGCPVCVTPLETIDKALLLAQRPDVILVSYGDMLRVPGSTTDLLHIKAQGGDVRMVYSPLDSLKIARENPSKEVVFFGIGFETTAPPNAASVWQAKRQGLTNFSLLASHVLVPPAVRSLMSSEENRVQGLIAPGHVCTIVGAEEYVSLSKELKIPIVIGGFEPVDLLEAILMLTQQLEQGRAEVENQYVRTVGTEGNARAQQLVKEIFEVSGRKWRGLGYISGSGLKMREAWKAYDAEAKFGLQDIAVEEPKACISSMILQGLKKPTDCPAFAIQCSPQTPFGAPMVSSEGACAAYYHYRRHSPEALIAIGEK